MKHIFLIFFLSLLISCKGEPLKPKEKIEALKKESFAPDVSIQKNKEVGSRNCYDYLTELVRSSSFSFSEWNISPNKTNLEIDEETDEYISAKLVFETEGTGTIGWIKYYINTKKLYDTSAALEVPQELNFDKKWSILFEECLNKNTEVKSSDDFEAFFKEKTKTISLPLEYNYSFISNEENFIDLPERFSNKFNLKHLTNLKIVSLPILQRFRPSLLIGYDELGQSKMYLFILDENLKPLSNVLLYDSEETENGSISTTYAINQNYTITIKKSLISDSGSNIKEKNISTKKYTINNEGKIINK